MLVNVAWAVIALGFVLLLAGLLVQFGLGGRRGRARVLVGVGVAALIVGFVMMALN